MATHRKQPKIDAARLREDWLHRVVLTWVGRGYNDARIELLLPYLTDDGYSREEVLRLVAQARESAFEPTDIYW
jgi:hypothetical protein